MSYEMTQRRQILFYKIVFPYRNPIVGFYNGKYERVFLVGHEWAHQRAAFDLDADGNAPRRGAVMAAVGEEALLSEAEYKWATELLNLLYLHQPSTNNLQLTTGDRNDYLIKKIR